MYDIFLFIFPIRNSIVDRCPIVHVDLTREIVFMQDWLSFIVECELIHLFSMSSWIAWSLERFFNGKIFIKYSRK